MKLWVMILIHKIQFLYNKVIIDLMDKNKKVMICYKKHGKVLQILNQV